MAEFRVKTARPEWEEMPGLARACEYAGLNHWQASAARLAALGFSIGEIGQRLEIKDYPAARSLVRNAAIRLEKTERAVLGARRAERYLFLQVARAGHLRPDRETSGVTPAKHYRLTAARAFGEVAEDCLPDARQKPLAFLRALYNLLTLT